jgi:hypothetical protein
MRPFGVLVIVAVLALGPAARGEAQALPSLEERVDVRLSDAPIDDVCRPHAERLWGRGQRSTRPVGSDRVRLTREPRPRASR